MKCATAKTKEGITYLEVNKTFSWDFNYAWVLIVLAQTLPETSIQLYKKEFFLVSKILELILANLNVLISKIILILPG